MKRCGDCGWEKPLSDFHKHSGHKDGHSSHCKECRKTEREANRLRRKGYYDANREAEQEKARKRMARYRTERPEELQAIYERWRVNNPDDYRAHKRRYGHWRRAQMKQTDITKDWLLELQYSTPECICGVVLTDDNRHLDHIVPLNIGGTHTKNNVRYLCATCNLTRPKKGGDLHAR